MSNLNKVSQVICGVMLAGVILYFFIYIFSHSYNVFYAPDDLIIFLDQHMAYKEKGPSHLLQYLVSISKYPHPKLTGRIFALLSEGFTGQINFRLIQILGNFGFVILLLVIRKMLDLKWDFVKLLPFALLFFVPIVNSFWTISIASLPWLFIFLLMSIYYFVNEKPFAAIFFTFLTVFTSGQGFLVLPLIGLLFLVRAYKYKKIIKSDMIWVASGLIIALLYYFLVIDIKTDSTGNGIVSAILDNVDGVSTFARIKTFFSFLSVYPQRAIGYLSFDKNLGAIIGSVLFLLLGFLSYRTFRMPDNKSSLVFFFFTLFFILMGVIAVYTRLCNKLGDEFPIPGRYEAQSLMFLAGLFALSLVCLPKVKYIKYLILGIALFLYAQKAPKSYQFFDQIKQRQLNKIHYTLGQNTDRVEYSEDIYSTLIKAKLDGLYKTPTEVLIKKVEKPNYSKRNENLTSVENKVILDRHFEDEHFLYVNWYTFKKNNSQEELMQYFLLVDEENETEHYFSPYYSNSITQKEKVKFKYKKNKNSKLIYTGALIEKSLLSDLKSTYSAYAVIITMNEEFRIPLKENIFFNE